MSEPGVGVEVGAGAGAGVDLEPAAGSSQAPEPGQEAGAGVEVAVAADSKGEPEGQEEPPHKRRKVSAERTEKLELRLGGILCCAVCLDLPSAAVYQCSNGHLMCAACFTHLLADARLRDEAATCPNCRVEISKSSASRNLAVEKAVSELPSECKFCAQVFPRHSLERHEEKICEDSKIYKFSQIDVNAMKPKYNMSFVTRLVRIVASFYHLTSSVLRRLYLVSEVVEKRRTFHRLSGCKYACIGCLWRGPNHELTEHELSCLHPKKTGAEVVEFLATREKQRLEEQALYSHLHELLSYEKITFSDLQLKPYRTDEFVNKLYYETSRFSAFNHQWVVKAYINHSQRDPTQSYDREITYQLILKTKSPCALPVQYMALRGPYGEANIALRVHSHNFASSDDVTDAPPVPLPLSDSRETNRLLSNKIIHFRLIMFLTSK